MQHVIITSMCYLTHYDTFSLGVAWFGAICNALSRVSVKFMKQFIYLYIYIYIYIIIFKKKMMVTRDNASQIAQNQTNLRENIR